MQMRVLNHQTIIKCDQIIRSSQALTDFVMVSEHYRKKFSEKLRESLSNNDTANNQIFELQQNKRLSDIQYDLAEKKLNMMFDSIGTMSNTKHVEDKFQYQLDTI